MSRKFLYNNPGKFPKLPLECKYHASPIIEQKSENYNTYDESATGKSGGHMYSIGGGLEGLSFEQMNQKNGNS